MDHFEYIRSLVGIDHVTFGPDTVYDDHVGLHDVYAANLSIKASRSSAGSGSSRPLERVEFVDGLENPTEGSRNLLRALVRAGHGDEAIAKVMGGNALRVLAEVWQ